MVLASAPSPFFSAASPADETPLTPEDLWLGKAVPRYTSYPPASLFEPRGSADYVRALALLPQALPTSLYLHIPFCRSVCLYCGCNTCATNDEGRVERYLKSLSLEAKMVSSLWAKKRRISRIHFGGGSPNILSERALDALFLELDHRFDLSSASEIAMELDPRLVTLGQASILAACGVSRVSLGVQDFNPAVQKVIGRPQPFRLVERAVEMLRGAGIRQISLDLMYGLPLQTPSSVAETAKLALSLDPDRISLFSYAHVPSFKKHQRVLEAYGLPDPYLQLTMEQASRAVLRSARYVEIGLDHFAKPSDPLAKALWDKKLHRNFQGYTDDTAQTLLALGASGIGFVGSSYFQNERDAKPYQETLAAGRFPVVRGLTLSGEDKLRARIIEELMCTFECNIEAVCREENYALAALQNEMEALRPFERAGLVALDGYKLRMTSPYRVAVRVIANVFDSATRTKALPSSRAM